MSVHYSNSSRETDAYALPDVEIFQLTAVEAAQLDEDLLYEYMRKHEYRLASMNSLVRDRMLDAIVSDQNITGGWFYWFCLPGCLPDSSAFGPYASHAEALAAARDDDDWSGDEA